MPTCTTCGEPATGPSAFDCSYCTGTYCRDHRLPERHDCPGLDLAESPGSHSKLITPGRDVKGWSTPRSIASKLREIFR